MIIAVAAILFNKPYGVLSQFTDEGTGHPTLRRYVPIPHVYAAGRLDRDSEGLLILTDDAPLAARLTDPAHQVVKTYWVLVEGNPKADALKQLESGLELKGYRSRPAKVRVIPDPVMPPRSKPVTPHGPTSWLEIQLQEGKKRQIRHMTAAVGLFTLRLVRVAIGPVWMKDLAVGEWRHLTASELGMLGSGKV